MIKSSKQIRDLKLAANKKVLNLFAGNYSSIFKGQGLDFEDLRLYEPGDSVKDIDWNATAKTGEVFIKKYIETKENKVLFAVDGSSSLLWNTQDKSKIDIILDLIYIISFAAISNNDRFGSVIYADKPESLIELKKGNIHSIRILREVEKYFKNLSQNKESNIETLLTFLLSSIKKRLICFILTDFIDCFDPKIHKLLKAVSKKHQIYIIQINDINESLAEFGVDLSFVDIETLESNSLNLSNSKQHSSYTNAYNNFILKNKEVSKQVHYGYSNLDQNSNLILEMIRLIKKKK